MKIQFDETKIRMSLEKTSLDDATGSYLVHDQDIVVNFDEVSKQIGQQLRLGNKPRSCDALYRGQKYNFLIEFKNMKASDIKHSQQPELHEKAYDSFFQLMIYLDTRETIDQLSAKTRLIVVYNDAKEAESAATDVASSPSIDKMVRKLKVFSKLEDLDTYPKKFKLERLQGKLYDKVLTIDVTDFNRGIKNLIVNENT